jgi:hypothetical protein
MIQYYIDIMAIDPKTQQNIWNEAIKTFDSARNLNEKGHANESCQKMFQVFYVLAHKAPFRENFRCYKPLLRVVSQLVFFYDTCNFYEPELMVLMSMLGFCTHLWIKLLNDELGGRKLVKLDDDFLKSRAQKNKVLGDRKKAKLKKESKKTVEESKETVEEEKQNDEEVVYDGKDSWLEASGSGGLFDFCQFALVSCIQTKSPPSMHPLCFDFF